MTLLSMTGFGDARDERADYFFAVEVRTINSRYLKINLRSTDGYGALDSRIESVAREFVKRGTVNLNVRIQHLAGEDDYRLNTQVLDRYVEQLQELARQRGLPEDVRLEPLSQLPGAIIDSAVATHDPETVWQLLAPIVRTAFENLSDMRAAEGKALAADLKEQCDTVAACLDIIETRKPAVAENYRQRIHDRVSEALSGLNVTIEPADLVREVCLFADRADISEETVRLRSHLQQFEKTTQLPDSAGRKLEFICQEMGRETNTIGSKANDAEISQQVVEIKTALERIREQIQNVQ